MLGADKGFSILRNVQSKYYLYAEDIEYRVSHLHVYTVEVSCWFIIATLPDCLFANIIIKTTL